MQVVRRFRFILTPRGPGDLRNADFSADSCNELKSDHGLQQALFVAVVCLRPEWDSQQQKTGLWQPVFRIILAKGNDGRHTSGDYARLVCLYA